MKTTMMIVALNITIGLRIDDDVSDDGDDDDDQ